MTHSFVNAARSVLIVASTVALFAVSQTVVAMSFTLSRTSPSLGLGPYSPSDIFTSPPGPAGGPPAFLASSISLGPMDNIDAMAWGPQGGLHEIFFSVGPGAAGAPVMVESGFGQQAGDIYSSLGGGGNMLSVNQAASGLLPAIGPGIAFAGPLDDIDSLDRNSPALIGSGGFPGVPILFSLDPASPFLASFGYTAGDILIAVPGFGAPVIPFGLDFATLGLMLTDDIDALILDFAMPGAGPFFSLAPGSPSLAALGFGPGDLLMPVPGFPPALAIPAGALGLLPTDNLNAATIPLPAPVWLLASAMAVLFSARRRVTIA